MYYTTLKKWCHSFPFTVEWVYDYLIMCLQEVSWSLTIIRRLERYTRNFQFYLLLWDVRRFKKKIHVMMLTCNSSWVVRYLFIPGFSTRCGVFVHHWGIHSNDQRATRFYQFKAFYCVINNHSVHEITQFRDHVTSCHLLTFYSVESAWPQGVANTRHRCIHTPQMHKNKYRHQSWWCKNLIMFSLCWWLIKENFYH